MNSISWRPIRKPTLPALALAIVAAIFLSCRADAATIVFQAGISPTGTYDQVSQDIRGTGGNNNGVQTLVGYQSGGGVQEIRTVMAFDLSAIPVGATINSISLTLVSDGNQSGTINGVGAVNLYEVTPNGNASNLMVEGQLSKVTWKTGSAWTTPLGDYTPTPLTTAVLNNTNANTVLDVGETATFGSTTAFVNSAQIAFSSGRPIQFILIAPTAEATTGTSNFFRFASDDYTTTPASRPALTVTYTPAPEPTSAGLLLAGGALLARRRRHR